MFLTEYMKKYNIHPVKFAVACDCSPGTIYGILNGKHKPRQDLAERIEKNSDNLVTVKELRGVDDREKRRRREVYDDVLGADLESDTPSYLRCD